MCCSLVYRLTVIGTPIIVLLTSTATLSEFISFRNYCGFFILWHSVSEYVNDQRILPYLYLMKEVALQGGNQNGVFGVTGSEIKFSFPLEILVSSFSLGAVFNECWRKPQQWFLFQAVLINVLDSKQDLSLIFLSHTGLF